MPLAKWMNEESATAKPPPAKDEAEEGDAEDLGEDTIVLKKINRHFWRMQLLKLSR